MSSLIEKLKKNFFSSPNFIRLEIFFCSLFFWILYKYCESFSDLEFNSVVKDASLVVFFLAFLSTFFLKFSKKALHHVSNLVCLTGLAIIIYVVADNSFTSEGFFLFVFAYCIFIFSISNTKVFLLINAVASAILIVALFIIKFNTIVSLPFIIGVYITIGLAGYFATLSRNFYREKIKDRENLLNKIFNNSYEGILLINKDRNRIVDANTEAVRILGFRDLKNLKTADINDIHLSKGVSFKNVFGIEQKTIQREDKSFLQVKSKNINYSDKEYFIIEITEYKNRHELSIAEEFDNLKTITTESYESLFNSNASMMCVVGKDEKIIDINRTFLEILGYNSEEVIGKRYDHFDYNNYNKERELINKKTWAGETQLFEKEIVNKEGNIVFIEVILRKAKYFGKDVLISNSRDISQRKMLKKIADYNYLQYSTLFRESPIALVISDLDGDILEINESFEKLIGYEKEEILGRNIKFFSDPDDMKKNFILREKLIRGEISSLEMQKRYLTKENKTIHTLLKIVIQKSEDDIPNKLLAQIVDITEIVKAEKKLKQSEKSYKEIFNNSYELLYVLNRDNVFIDVNRTVIEEYGYKREEILGKTPIFFGDEKKNDFDAVGEKIGLAWEGEEQNFLWWSKRKDGSVFPKDLHLRKGMYFGKEVLLCSGRNISDEFEYEQQLIESEKKYKDLIHKSIFGIIIFKNDYVAFANNKAQEILKYKSVKELVGKHRDEVILINDTSSFEKRIEKLKKRKKINLQELTFVGANNIRVSVESKPAIIEFEGEECILNTFFDISDRKQVEFAEQKVKEAKSVNESLKIQLEQNRLIQRRLQNSQSYSEGIIESSLDMIFTTDIKGKITKINSAAKKELLLNGDEFLKMPFEILFRNKEIGEEILRVLNQNNAFSGEVELKRKDGSYFPAFLSISYLFNLDGAFLGIMGVSRDISDIISKEKEIKEQASKLTAIIESSSHFFCTINKNYRITSLNESFIADTREKEDCEIELFDEIFKIFERRDPEEYEEIKTFWAEKIDIAFSGKSIQFETESIAKDGKPYYREVYFNPIYSGNGKIEEVSGIGHDTTQKKLYEKELENSLDEKEILLKEVHHRVKNNMQVISSILNLQSAYVKDKNILSVLRESQNRISAMASIHERLYRTENFSDIKFSSYVKNLAKSLVNTYELSDISVKLHFDLDEVFLTLNAAIPCGLIINELISNALKYAFVGKEHGQITISLKQVDEEVTLSIADNGVGIPEGVNFNNTDTLGLQLVKTLVEQIEGEIKLEKEMGTKFSVVFNANKEK